MNSSVKVHIEMFSVNIGCFVQVICCMLDLFLMRHVDQKFRCTTAPVLYMYTYWAFWLHKIGFFEKPEGFSDKVCAFGVNSIMISAKLCVSYKIKTNSCFQLFFVNVFRISLIVERNVFEAYVENFSHSFFSQSFQILFVYQFFHYLRFAESVVGKVNPIKLFFFATSYGGSYKNRLQRSVFLLQLYFIENWSLQLLHQALNEQLLTSGTLFESRSYWICLLRRFPGRPKMPKYAGSFWR